MTLHRSIGAALEASGTVGTTPIDVRKDFERLFIRDGLLPGSAAPLVVGTTGFAYRVGKCGLVTQTAANDGYHLWGNDGNVDISVSDTGAALTAPSSGLYRYDIIYARHPSRGENSDTTSAPLVAVAKGVASSPSPPAVPAIPTGAKELARNLMTSAATTTLSTGNTITQTIPYTAPRGGIIPCRNTSERDALIPLATAENPIYADIAGALYVCADATAFKPVLIGDTDWVAPLSWGTGYTSQTFSTLRSRVVGGCELWLKGLLRPDSGAAIAAGGVAVATLVSAHRPTEIRRHGAVGWVGGGGDTYLGDSGITVSTAGVVTVYVPANRTGVYVDCVIPKN